MEIRCPECRSKAVNKYGKTVCGKQRYLCLVCERQFIANPQNTILVNRPHCPTCGNTMHSYMKGEGFVRFRCSVFPKCRTFLKVSVSELMFEKMRRVGMISTKYSIQDFFSRISNVPSWEAMYLASKEATAAERILIREKALDNAGREKISTYAKLLKEFVTYTRSAVDAPVTSKKNNPLLRL